MKIQQIRNATMRISYAEKVILTDPYLAKKHSMKSHAGKAKSPLVDLPMKTQKIIDGVDLCLLSHIHSDHFDQTAQNLLPKNLPVYCQPIDQQKIESRGFTNVHPVIATSQQEGIIITRTTAIHGSGEVLAEMGEGSGYILKSNNEPTVYWTGDSIWCEEIADIIKKHKPDIILTHSCGAVWGDQIPIIMNAEQTFEVCRFAPHSIVIAIHMGTVDHGTVKRSELRAMAEKNGISAKQLLIPEDGEIITYN